ncbi:MAG: NifU family protein, partial [Solobacterium sp.]|nr:NifU family protein [Solobacterium sp.]
MDINNKEDKIKLVKQTIEKIRPYLQRDGGDVEFVSLEDDVVYVK